MSTKYQQKVLQTRRQHILDAAIAVIARNGFQKTTIKQIAAEAEVADGTIYNYFKNKEAILLAIINQVTEAEVRDIHFSQGKQVDLTSFISEYTSHRMTEMDAMFNIMKVVISESLANPALGHTAYSEIYEPTFKIAEQFFHHLMEQGDLPTTDPAYLSRLFAALPMGLLTLRMLGDAHVEENWQTYGEMLGNAMLKILGYSEVRPVANQEESD